MESEKANLPEADKHSVNDPPPKYLPPSKPEPFAEPTTAIQAYTQQKPQSQLVVVTLPSQQPVISHGYQSSVIGSFAYILAIIVSVIGFCFCCDALICSIPAIIYAKKSKTAVDEASAKQYTNVSLFMSGVALVVGVIQLGIIGLVIWLYAHNGFTRYTG